MADKPVRSLKRRVKNPESFRQRAEKAAEEASQPKKPNRFKAFFSALVRPVRAILRPVNKLFKQLGRYKAVRRLAKPLRLVGRVLWPRYVRNSWRELRLVTWPGWKLSRQLTYAVLAFAIVFGGAIAALDYGLDKLFKQILLK